MSARVLSSGDRFADYVIVRLLGAGGFGAVYEAEHALTGRPAALKIAHPHIVEEEDARARAVQEARALGELQHPNIVSLQNAGLTSDGQVWIAMELLSGWTLRDLLRRRLPLEQATAILAETCEGLAAAHDIAIVHRDIKPENVFVTTQMAIKVLDFTAAKAAGRGIVQSTGQTSGEGARRVLGTPAYMSPEQVRGERVDCRTDLYSLGVMAYEIVARRHPFANEDGTLPNEFELARRHESVEPAALKSISGDVPDDLAVLLGRLLSKQRQDRPARARDVATALRTIRERYLQAHASPAFAKEWRGAGSFAATGSTGLPPATDTAPRQTGRRVVLTGAPARSRWRHPAGSPRSHECSTSR